MSLRKKLLQPSEISALSPLPPSSLSKRTGGMALGGIEEGLGVICQPLIFQSFLSDKNRAERYWGWGDFA